VSTPSGDARFTIAASQSGSAGQAITNQQTQSGLNVQLPNFSKFKFQSTRITTGNYYLNSAGAIDDDACYDTWIFEVMNGSQLASTSNYQRYFVYTSIGTDLNMYFFINTPSYYIYSALPNAN